MMRQCLSGVILSAIFSVSVAQAHCDTMDGPVVQAAQKALDAGDVTSVLRWVPEKDEAELKAAFQKAQAVRGKGAEAKELADRYFFETLVRIHREGEGVAYSGIKPHGTEVEAGILAADRAMARGSADEIKQHLLAAVSRNIDARFARAAETAKHADQSVAAGRKAVAAYVDFMHYVEGLHAAVTAAGHAAHAEAAAHSDHAAAPHPGEAPAAHEGAAPHAQHAAPHAPPKTAPAAEHHEH